MSNIELIIDEKIKELIPPLNKEEFIQLEQNILKEGVREPIAVWKGIIIDGHNRYTIAKKHNLGFEVKEYDFESEEEVYEWIDNNQFGRRNLKPLHYKLLMGRLYNRKKLQRGAQTGNKNASKNKTENISDSKETSKIIAEELGVSYRTIEKAGLIQSQVKRVSELMDISEYKIVDSLNSESELYKFSKRIKDIRHESKIKSTYNNWSFNEGMLIAFRETIKPQAKRLNNYLKSLRKQFRVIFMDLPKGTPGSMLENFNGDLNTVKIISYLSIKSILTEDTVVIIKTDQVVLRNAIKWVTKWKLQYNSILIFPNQYHPNKNNDILIICTNSIISTLENGMLNKLHDLLFEKYNSYQEFEDQLTKLKLSKIWISIEEVVKDNWDTISINKFVDTEYSKLMT